MLFSPESLNNKDGVNFITSAIQIYQVDNCSKESSTNSNISPIRFERFNSLTGQKSIKSNIHVTGLDL